MDEHVIEGLGKARIVVRDGKVVEVGEPMISYCPIFGITPCGKDLIEERLKFTGKGVASNPDAPKPDKLV